MADPISSALGQVGSFFGLGGFGKVKDAFGKIDLDRPGVPTRQQTEQERRRRLVAAGKGKQATILTQTEEEPEVKRATVLGG